MALIMVTYLQPRAGSAYFFFKNYFVSIHRSFRLPGDCRPFTFHTLAHALHPNSAAYFTRNRLLVTFFHIHKLAFLDRDTGAVTLLPLSLSFPHAIRPARGQPLGSGVAFSVCNTRGGEVVLLDRDVQEIRRIKLNCQWIQVPTQSSEP